LRRCRVAEWCDDVTFGSVITTPEEFAALLRADHKCYGELIRSIGFNAD
jgi:hypothetical protein